MSYRLRFRQIHLDFHTSPDIEGIGEDFDKRKWQEVLREGHVDSITLFSKCHHGLSYHPTAVGRMHPHLRFDLLARQIEACREIDVRTPIYISAGLDDVAAEAHPQWREISVNGSYQGGSAAVNRPGFKKLCFRTAYLEYLCDQIREVARLYPEGHGIFLDIIYQGECCCRDCVRYMRRNGLDINLPQDRRRAAENALQAYYRETTAACRSVNPELPVFHNSGHIARGRRDRLAYFSHLELESLPTGGWGYDHFPMSAAYARGLGFDFLGMTGKFHHSWGEFGNCKHPNALRYECSLMLAQGAKCSVGDQLHPSGALDKDTYRIIGAAFEEVEKKQSWCDNVRSVADIGVLTGEKGGDAARHALPADDGSVRVLLEEHLLFDMIDRDNDFGKYRLLILPDCVRLDAALEKRLRDYLNGGGRLLLSGSSGLRADADEFALDVGARYVGISEHQPDYLVAGPELVPDFVGSPLVMYQRSHKVELTEGTELAGIERPYFNRTWDHYCSHQHAPNAGATPYPAAVRHGAVLYLAHPVFSHYYAMGAVAYRRVIARAIRLMLGEETLRANLPSTARTMLMFQPEEARYVLHLLYAVPVLRGGRMTNSPEGYVREGFPVEVIEDLVPLHDIQIDLKIPHPVRRVTSEPQGTEIEFREKGGRIHLELERLLCHGMIVLHVEPA